MSPMKTIMHDFSGTVKESPEIMTIHTTLYDLSAALSAEVGPDEEDVLTAAFMHLLNTHRVTCTGNLKGYRLRVCNAGGAYSHTQRWCAAEENLSPRSTTTAS